MVDVPGGDGANEGFWRFQIRDKYGRWVQMGGAVTFTTDHPNYGRISGSGTFAGGSRPGFALVKVEAHHSLKDGSYEVPSDDFEAVKAIIPKDSPGLAKAKGLDAADGVVTNGQTGIFQKYGEAGKNAAEDTPLTDLGFDPEQEITVYRGVPTGVDTINPGDWVTSLFMLAEDYAGEDGTVISMKIKAKDLLADPSSGEGAYTEEMLYRPKEDTPGEVDVVDKTAEERGAVDAAEGWSETGGVQGKGESSLLDSNLTNEAITYAELSEPVSAMDADMFTRDQRVALKGYTGTDYSYINKLLRTGEASDTLRVHLEKEVVDLDSAIEENGILEEPARVFRGVIGHAPGTSGFNGTDWAEVMKNLQVGDVFSDDGYMSTSNDPSVAHDLFGPGSGATGATSTKYSPSNEQILSSNANVFFSIDLPAGSKALGVPDEFSTSNREKEVLLARGTKLKVKAIRRVKQDRTDKDAYNYYVEAEAVID